MAESDNDFILIKAKNNNGNKELEQQTLTELNQSILAKNAISDSQSVDGWSEISAPSSRKSGTSISKKVSSKPQSVFAVFATMIPGLSVNGKAETLSMRSSEGGGYFMIDPLKEQNVATKEKNINVENDHVQSNQNTNNHSIGSVGSRIPFSFAEITKIQPLFHHDTKPKVFGQSQTVKIKTKYRVKNNAENEKNNKPEYKNEGKLDFDDMNDDDAMPSIPESKICATKNDPARRVQRSRKKGNRLKYANNRRGGAKQKNWRKKAYRKNKL